jgi:putative phosphoribosyl transferase
MGFGVVTLDEQVILNNTVVQETMLDRDVIRPIVDEVYREVLRRDREYRGAAPFPDLRGRCVIITDDGLATGYTMLGAIRFAREKGAAKIIAAVPVAHREAFELVSKTADRMYCLHIDENYSFAVALFYESFPDMTDAEVKELLEKAHIDRTEKRHLAAQKTS